MTKLLQMKTAHLVAFCFFSTCRAAAIAVRRTFRVTIILVALVITLSVITRLINNRLTTSAPWNKTHFQLKRLAHQPNCNACRLPEDGKWFIQSKPFPIFMYSAFYDNRTSLETSTSQIVLIGQFRVTSIDRCVLWFVNNTNSRTVPARIQGLAKLDKLLICLLPANIYGSQIPVEVAPAWPNKSTASGYSRAMFRLPVEVPRWTSTRGYLALCLTARDGDEWQPQQIVEWLEMQRLLGVERVIVYNQSMPEQLRRVFNEYSVDGVENDHQKNIVVDLRQTHGILLAYDDESSHQTPTLNDCFYRNMGSFRYIAAAIDADELIVPRQNFTTIPELIDHLTADHGLTIGSFVFRDVHYFVEGHANDTDEEIYRLIPASYRNCSSLPSYLTKRRRAVVPSPLGYYMKSVINSDACLGVWVHFCYAFTSKFAMEHKSKQLFHVEPELALKHHNRKGCTFDRWLASFKMDSCQRALRTSILDDVLLKYNHQLLGQLLKQHEKLQWNMSKSCFETLTGG